jgi:glycosyltransferase involved in cell wall biosynthesis
VPLLVSVLPSDLARTRGGGERYAFELHAALARELGDPWEAQGITAAGERADELIPAGWRGARGEAGSLPSTDAISARAVLAAVPRRADLVLLHQWRTRGGAALRLRHALARGGKLVGIDYGGGSVAGYRLNRLPLPAADLGAHISEFERRISPVRARRHVVIHGGTDPERFTPPAAESRDVDFLLVGRFLPHKGQELLLEALPEGARARLIGPSDSDDPAYMARVRERAAALGVDVVLDARDADLVEAYRGARYTVQVPRLTVDRRDATPPELLGLTLLEAMACGSVPVCPADGPSAEFVHDGRTGYTYELGSRDQLARTLAAALAAEDERERLRRAALEECGRWTWPAAASALLAAL